MVTFKAYSPAPRRRPSTGQRVSEVRPHPRHRGSRQDHQAQHVLPDRQLQLRRLLQEGAIATPGTGSQDDGCLGFDAEIGVSTCSDDEAAPSGAASPGLPEERIQAPRAAGQLLAHGDCRSWRPGASEIYVDRGSEYGPEADRRRGRPLPGDLEPLQLPVRKKDDFDIVAPLPRPNIDTGMGLERAAYLLQGVDNLYEIDQVFPVGVAAELSGEDLRAGALRRRSYAGRRGPHQVRADVDRRRPATRRAAMAPPPLRRVRQGDAAARRRLCCPSAAGQPGT